MAVDACFTGCLLHVVSQLRCYRQLRRHTRTRSSRRARSRIRFLAQPKKASASLYRTGLPVQKHRGSRYGTGTVICVNISNPIAKGSVESGCIHTAPRVNSRLYRNVAAMPCFARGRRPDVRPLRALPHIRTRARSLDCTNGHRAQLGQHGYAAARSRVCVRPRLVTSDSR